MATDGIDHTHLHPGCKRPRRKPNRPKTTNFDAENPCKSRMSAVLSEYTSSIPSPPDKKRQMPPSIRGYDMFEVVSAYQKAIRRSDTDAALYWGAEAHRSGYAKWIWKRLRVIVSEDVGPAAPSLPANVEALFRTAQDFGIKDSLMFFVHATILAARAPKSRICDWALFTVANTDRPKDREVPDHALDKHTLRGKQMGRGKEHFLEEASRLEQPRLYGRPPEAIDPEIRHLEKQYRQQRFMEDR
jgi:hypothetical protein